MKEGPPAEVEKRGEGIQSSPASLREVPIKPVRTFTVWFRNLREPRSAVYPPDVVHLPASMTVSVQVRNASDVPILIFA
jgi:hypothetical protein